MASINSNSVCHPIVQILATSDLNPKFLVDAAQILSCLRPFNQSAYCQDGCKVIRKLFSEIALKVHPDKCRNNELAAPAFIKASEAKRTLCGADEIRKLCDAGALKNSLPASISDAYSEIKKKATDGDTISMHALEDLWNEDTISSSEEEKSSVREAIMKATGKDVRAYTVLKVNSTKPIMK